jgi:glycopeptide antibiotics resistance protein
MWWGLWLISIAVIVSVTTLPLSNYMGHTHWDAVRWIPFRHHPLSVRDVLANVALFIPFGFCLGRAMVKAHRWKRVLLALVFSAVLSSAVEYFQVYCHNRIPSTTDICTNVLGAVLGTLAAFLKSHKEQSL